MDYEEEILALRRDFSQMDKNLALQNLLLQQLSDVVEKLNKKLDDVEDANNFNFIKWLKNSLLPVLLSAGAIYIILEVTGKLP